MVQVNRDYVGVKGIPIQYFFLFTMVFFLLIVYDGDTRDMRNCDYSLAINVTIMH